MEELGLIKEALSGDRNAAQALVETHYQLVFSFILRMVADTQLALDLTQDVFVKALARLRTYRGKGKFSSWLLSIAANRVRDHWRRAARQPGGANVDVFSLAGQDDFTQESVEREQVRLALAQLSLPQREAVILRFYHDLSLAEIAQVTGANLSTAKSRLRLGLINLKELLGGEGNV